MFYLLSQTEAATPSAPAVAAIGMLAFAGIGIVLLLFGRRLAKLAVSLVGLFYGVVITLTVGEIFGVADQWLLLVTIAGGLIGLGLTRTIFRFWTTVGTGLVLGYLAPAIMLAAVDARLISLPQDDEATEGASPYVVATEEAKKQVDAATGDLDAAEAKETLEGLSNQLGGIEEDSGIGAVFSEILGRGDKEGDAEEPNEAAEEDNTTDDGLLSSTAEAGSTAFNVLKASGESLRVMYATETEHLNGWWQEKGAGYRQQLLLSSFVGFGVGIGLGLLMPKLALSIQTSLIGAVLLTLPGRTVLEQWLGTDSFLSGILPHTPRMVLLTVCLITVVGVFFQCRGKSKKADD